MGHQHCASPSSRVPKVTGLTIIPNCRADGLRGPVVAKDYTFFFPGTWAPLTVAGVDEVYMDVVEQLDNLTLKRAPTDKASLAELGTPQEVGIGWRWLGVGWVSGWPGGWADDLVFGLVGLPSFPEALPNHQFR